MFNSSVLDVAIGLIFVYLLLGLMCTTVNEWLAQLFKTRAATLKEGIRRLLNAQPKGTYLIRPEDIHVTALAKRWNQAGDQLAQAVGPLEEPLQASLDQFRKDLADNPDAEPPAALAGLMAQKLNALLNKPGLLEKIDTSKVTVKTKAALAKPRKEKDLPRLNRALLNEAYPDEIASLSESFYNHPLVKSLARPGKHPSYVPSKTFALALLDIFAKGQSGAGTADQTLAQVKTSIDNLPDSDVKKSLQALLLNGSDSLDKVEAKLESWFNDSMDRVSGWYKNRVQVWTVIIASLITILVNADTIQIAQKLMINPALRDKIVQEAKTANAPPADQTAPTLNVTAKRRPEQLNRLDRGVPDLPPSGRLLGSKTARSKLDRGGLPNPIQWRSKIEQKYQVRSGLEQRCLSGHTPVGRAAVPVALDCCPYSPGWLGSDGHRRFSGSAFLVRHAE